MNSSEISPLILIYYNFRGQLQPIRNMLCFLSAPFYQIHLEMFDIQKKQMPIDILNELKGVRIDKTKLPIMVHQGLVIYQTYPMLSYISYRFQRQDLLGNTMHQKARVQQLMEMYLNKQPASMVELFRVAEFAYQNSNDPITILIEQDQSYDYLMEKPGYMTEICEVILQSSNNKYVLGNRVTIIDFLFLQTSIYMNGALGILINNRQKVKGVKKNRRVKKSEKDNLQYLKIMRQYRDRIMKEEFYRINHNFLESFSIISSFTSEERAGGLRVYWSGDPKLVM